MRLLINIVIALLVAGLLLTFVRWRLDELYGELPATARSDPEAKALFDALWRQQLMSINPNGRITLMAEDALLARRAAGESTNIAEIKAQQKMLNLLYSRPSGEVVKQQVALWNRNRDIVAIRDDRRQPGDVSRWHAEGRDGTELAATSSAPLLFGYLNGAVPPSGFHDWLTVSGKDETLQFSSEFELLEPQTITIQLIGIPDLSAIREKLQLLACYPDRPCQAVTQVSDALAYKVMLSLPAGPHRITLPVRSVVNLEKQLAESPIQITSSGQPFWDAEHPLAVWSTQSVSRPAAIKITTSDGIALTENSTDGEPRATPFTLSNGLISLIGEHQRMTDTLSGLAWQAASTSGSEVVLTLESRLQRIAQQVLERQLKKLAPSDGAQPSDQRRAAVVFLNPHNGAVLAAANYPDRANPKHSWDRAVVGSEQPLSLLNGWQGVDKNNRPGSVFEIVTALAALDDARSGRSQISLRDRLLTILLEGVSIKTMAPLLGLKPTRSYYSVDSVTIHNPSGALAGSFNRPLRRADCAESETASDRMGLREAVRDSVDSWFARIAVIMDKPWLENEAADSGLSAMASRLGFGRQQSLVPLDLPLKRRDGGESERDYGDRLNAFNGSLALVQAKSGNRLSLLVESAVGRASTASPLEMAKVAAAIATGAVVTPYLIERWDQRTVTPAQPKMLDIPGLQLLRDGLKSVPEVGVLKKQFPGPIGCHIYGLSSHPEIAASGSKEEKKKRRKSHYSSWFIGWYGLKSDQPEFSFACFISRTGRNDRKLCAETVRQTIEQWTAARAKQ